MIMKRLFVCLVALMILLAGCVAPGAETPTTAPTTVPSQPTQGSEPTDPTEPTEPADPFDPWQPTINCEGHDSDPYENVDTTAFYASYTTACCYVDACYRTQHYLMSGSLEVPGR